MTFPVRSFASWALPILLMLAATPVVGADASPATDGAPAFTAEDAYALLSPRTPKDARQAQLHAAVVASKAGNGWASFVVASLMRNGKSHPGAIGERNLPVALDWLLRCLPQKGCTEMALASLAEIQLAAGDPERALPWAAAHAYVHRRVAQITGERAPTYASELLLRALHGADPGERQARVDAALARVARDWQAVLERMLESELQPKEQHRRLGPHQPYDLEAARGVSGEALYVIAVPVAGGENAGIALVEALPRPEAVTPLDRFARSARWRPSEDGRTEGIDWALQPMTYQLDRPLPTFELSLPHLQAADSSVD